MPTESSGNDSAKGKNATQKRGRTRQKRCYNRLRRTVREYALNTIFKHRDEIHTASGAFRLVSDEKRKKLWNDICIRVLRKYPTATVTPDSLMSLWRRVLWKVKKNTSFLQEYMPRLDNGLVADDGSTSSFNHIEIQMFRWLYEKRALRSSTYFAENWTSQSTYSASRSDAANDVNDLSAFQRSNSACSAQSNVATISAPGQPTTQLSFTHSDVTNPNDFPLNNSSDKDILVTAPPNSLSIPTPALPQQPSLHLLHSRFMQALQAFGHFESELRDISIELDEFSNAQNSAVSEVEKVKEENMRLRRESERLRSENEQLKSEMSGFIGSLSRCLSEYRSHIHS